MRFERLKKTATFVEIIGWLAVLAGVGVFALFASNGELFLGLALSGALIGGGLALVLFAGIGAALAFTADALEQERNALPFEGSKAPGWLVEMRYDKEIRRVGPNRFWVEGEVFGSQMKASEAIRRRSPL